MFYTLRKKLNTRYFNALTNEIKNRAYIKTDPDANFTIATLLCDSDVNMYLLSITSFCHYIQPQKIVVVSDRLSQQSCDALRRCIPEIDIVPAEDYREPGLPIGGCWERFTYIMRNVCAQYMVQLDADILTLKRPNEVIDAIKQNVSFSLTTKLGLEKMTFVNASYLVWERKSKHIQNEAEKALKDCNNAESRLYIRACAGFAGYAKDSFNIEVVKEFSKEIENKLGHEKWSEWGSEQVTSNYIIANSKDSVILPYEYYPFYEPGIDEKDIKLFHFIGTHRFKKGRYLGLARQLIKSL